MAEKIVVASGKGGVGKSSAVCGLCRSFAAMHKKVLVLDFDIGLRGLDVIFGVTQKILFDWGDIVLGRCEKEKALVEVEKEITLLAAPQSFSEKFTDTAIIEVVKNLEKDFDYVLFDAPAGIATGFHLAACCANRGIIVSTPDAICVRGGSVTADKLIELGIEDIKLIINRFNIKAVEQKKLLNIDDVIDATGIQLIGVVPDDAQVAFSASSGEPLSPKSVAASAFMRIAKRIAGENISLNL